MKKVAIVGVEGSGKTVMLAGKIKRNGAWPTATVTETDGLRAGRGRGQD